MPRRRESKRAIGTMMIWAANVIGVAVLLTVLVTYFTRKPAEAASSPFVYLGGTPRATATAVPTSYELPTVTPNPLSTPFEDYSTPTPFVFSGGLTPRVTGYSVLGQPITYYTFGKGPTQYLIVAGIHGGYEGNTVDLANQLIVYLTQHPDFVPEDATLYIIGDMNPDAVARGRNSDARANADGVDLNRNFPSLNWVPDWDHGLCWNYRPTTGGASGGSEPETRAVMNFVGTHRIRAMISYHSAALGVFPGGNPWQAESEALARQLSAITGYPFPPIDIGCNYTGTLADWAVESGVGAAVDMELANHQDAEFTKNLPAVKALLSFGK